METVCGSGKWSITHFGLSAKHEAESIASFALEHEYGCQRCDLNTRQLGLQLHQENLLPGTLSSALPG